MKTQTLKTLITQACDDTCKNNYLNSKVMDEMRDRIFMLIDLYEEDNKSHINPYYGSTLVGVPNGNISSTSENYCTNLGGGK